MKFLFALGIAGTFILGSCTDKEPERLKEELRQGLDSIEMELDSLMRSIDTLNEGSNPMVAEQLSREALHRSDSIFSYRTSLMEQRFSDVDWSVEQKSQVEIYWKKLIDFRAKQVNRIAEALYRVKDGQSRSIEEKLDASDQALEASKQNGFGTALNDIIAQTNRMNQEIRASLQLYRDKMLREKDSLNRQAEHLRDSLSERFLE